MRIRIARTHSLTETLDLKLSKAAESEKKTRSCIVRAALDQYLNKVEEK